VTAYCETAPKLAEWLEENVPEGLTVFSLPEHHHRRLRTSNLIERAIQHGLKRRIIKVRLFPHEEALEGLVIAVLCWSRSTNDGPSTQRLTSNGNAKMREFPKIEFPDDRLRNPD